MDQALVTCPWCKRANEAGDRFCRGCGRLLAEPDLHVPAASQMPRYEGYASIPIQPFEQEAADPGDSGQVPQPDATSARLLIRMLATAATEADAANAADAADDAQAYAPWVGEYALEGRAITVGRTQDCEIVLDGDTQTSRRHAILRCEDNQYSVADLGSSNGTYVNDREISAPTPLRHGDRILIGRHELLFLLDQPQVIAPQRAQAPEPADETADAAVSQELDPQRVRPTSAPVASGALAPAGATAGATASVTAGSTTKYASVSQLSTELAATASRMVASQQNAAELDAIRAQLLEASEALTQQVGLQAALADRRRAALVETRERLTDLITDLRGDDPEQSSPVQHVQRMSVYELVQRLANDPDNPERLRAVASRADELAQALRAQGPSEGRWSYERSRTLRSLDDMLFRLGELA